MAATTHTDDKRIGWVTEGPPLWWPLLLLGFARIALRREDASPADALQRGSVGRPRRMALEVLGDSVPPERGCGGTSWWSWWRGTPPHGVNGNSPRVVPDTGAEVSRSGQISMAPPWRTAARPALSLFSGLETLDHWQR